MYIEIDEKIITIRFTRVSCFVQKKKKNLFYKMVYIYSEDEVFFFILNPSVLERKREIDTPLALCMNTSNR